VIVEGAILEANPYSCSVRSFARFRTGIVLAVLVALAVPAAFSWQRELERCTSFRNLAFSTDRALDHEGPFGLANDPARDADRVTVRPVDDPDTESVEFVTRKGLRRRR
jgi:hypothetical protein